MSSGAMTVLCGASCAAVGTLILGSPWGIGVGSGVIPGLLLAAGVHGIVAGILRFAREEVAIGRGARHWLDPYGTLTRSRAARGRSRRDASFERVRGNLRLMGLAELWSAVRDEEPEAALLERVVAFCRRETGLEEIGLFRLDARSQELKGTWTTSIPGGRRANPVRWSLGGLDGGLMRALRAERPFLCFDEPGPPLLVVNGERPRVLDRDRGYGVFPLVAPGPFGECVDPRVRQRSECPAFQSHASNPRPATAPASRSGGGGLCVRCRRFPVHGVLVVATDGAKPRPTPGELGLLESLATTVASVLEHAALFRDVKNAERFRHEVLDAMLNALISTDENGRVVFANRKARDLVGSRELVGERLDEVVRLPEGSNAVTRTIVEGKAYLQADGLLRTDGDAPDIPVRLNLTPFRAEEGGRKGAVCVMEDRRAVRAMEDEIRHLDTLAAIGRFASSLAHEIRNPLGGIQAGIEYLTRNLDADEETRESLAVIHGEIRRLDGILRNMLSVARPRELVLSDCDPQDLVHRVKASFTALAEAVGVRLLGDVGETCDPIHADRDMLTQVLTNLVKNAIEASPTDGQVELRVLDRGGADGTEGVVFEVLDRGPGIAEADLPHLFEPFFSRKSNGTGLGLYVCHGLVQRHGGTLRAENRPGGGARFVVELPRVPALIGGRDEPSHSRRR